MTPLIDRDWHRVAVLADHQIASSAAVKFFINLRQAFWVDINQLAPNQYEVKAELRQAINNGCAQHVLSSNHLAEFEHSPYIKFSGMLLHARVQGMKCF